jgi:NTP pyrophosphatase (non-canonical NTP hydrolase)
MTRELIEDAAAVIATNTDAIRSVFAALSSNVYAMNQANGFWDGPQDSFGQKIALVHSELSEALEADRKDLMDDKLPDREGREVELADTMIRIFDLAGRYDLDLGGALVAKIAFNASRPYKHGKAY